MTEKQVNDYLTSLKAYAQITGEKIETLQLGNTCYIFVNSELRKEVEIF